VSDDAGADILALMNQSTYYRKNSGTFGEGRTSIFIFSNILRKCKDVRTVTLVPLSLGQPSRKVAIAGKYFSKKSKSLRILG
jgi:hypothetical protein